MNANVADAIRRHAAAIDADDLNTITDENHEGLLACMAAGDFAEVGKIMCESRKFLISRRASMEVYGSPRVISPYEVTL